VSNDRLTEAEEKALDAHAARHFPGGRPPAEPDPSGLAGDQVEDDPEKGLLDAHARRHFPSGGEV